VTASSSLLIEMFLKRVDAVHGTTSREVLGKLIANELRKCRGARSVDKRIQYLLRSRRIGSVDLVADLPCDGLLEPIGNTFTAGFRMLLKKDLSPTRLRFTLAHEISHTFFYELVPEIKFVPHNADPLEERLCDFGAAEILMPAPRIRKAVRGLPVCLQTLRDLAMQSSVSLTAMFLRLQALRLWKCELSSWYRMMDGTFVLSKFYGGKPRPWEWDDKSILNTAWQRNESSAGEAYVKFFDENRLSYWKAVKYEVQRTREGVLALWGHNIDVSTQNNSLLQCSLKN